MSKPTIATSHTHSLRDAEAPHDRTDYQQAFTAPQAGSCPDEADAATGDASNRATAAAATISNFLITTCPFE
jgi:hypothetical protein